MPARSNQSGGKKVEIYPVYVFGPRDRKRDGVTVVDTTSKAGWSSRLSPFKIGPCDLYGYGEAKLMENAWQFSKVYKCHADEDGEPTQAYWDWAEKGWASNTPHRYPMGKGAVPLYSLWDGGRLGYVEARKRIYIPLYAAAVVVQPAYERLKGMYLQEKSIGLWDYDGYDYLKLGMTLADVLECTTRKMGHAFTLAALLRGELTQYTGHNAPSKLTADT
jgi:hypothetical protein